jgi:ParB-like chromosome segregation protein Spo0J
MSEVEHLPETEVAVDSLVPGFYLRQAGTDSAHIRLLADAGGTVKLPPIIVQASGCRIIDGMHRVEAAKLRGDQHIRARVIDCSDSEALVLAIKSNTLHGLPLSKADRISGAKRILAAHQDWSDRAVAEVAGLSAKTIASLRNRPTVQAQFQGKRLGRDGKRRPLSAADGRRRAADYISAHPGASLREVAREADVSLGTVHDVTERIRNGSDPVRTERTKPADGSTAQPAAEAFAPRAAQPIPLRARVAERPGVQQLAWTTVSAKLVNDPALRYTEGGRAFLRWMGTHSAGADEWREFIDAVPTHWVRDVVRVAETVSAEWQEFAERLRTRQAAIERTGSFR